VSALLLVQQLLVQLRMQMIWKRPWC